MKQLAALFFFLLISGGCDRKAEAPSPAALKAQQRLQPGLQPSGQRREMMAETVSTAGNERPSRTTASKYRHRKRTGGEPVPSARGSRTADSMVVKRMEFFRSTGLEPDLNERVSEKALFGPETNGLFPSMIMLSRDSYLRINFDNDILDYTDRFYTNGIRIDLISPAFRMNFMRYIMIPYWGSGINHYGLSLVQNMYTPSTTKMGGILHGDRPYAAYLYVGLFRITTDATHTFRQTCELDCGIIGPGSYGEWVQRTFHNSVPTNHEPLGWSYQIRNDLVLNYSLGYEKGIVGLRSFEGLVNATGNIGTLYTNFQAGWLVRAGWMNPFFANPGVQKKAASERAGLRKTQFFMFLKGSGKLVGYDATLEGGLLNRTSTYTLGADEISRLVLQCSGGLTLSHNGIKLDVEQFMLSPEFRQGWWHKWVHVALTFAL